MSLTLIRTWYAIVTPAAVAFYDPLGQLVIRKPLWASPSLVRLLVRLQPAARVCLALAGLLLCLQEQPNFVLQSCFAILVTVLDFYSFHVLNCHLSFVLLYSSWALLLPEGPQRQGVLLAITAHQLGSSGVQKLRVGGLQWTNPKTFVQTLRNSLTTDNIRPAWITEPSCIKQRWMIRAMIERPWLCRLAAAGGMAFEVFVFPAAVVAMPSVGRYTLLAVTGFHGMIGLMHGIVFVFSVPCYALALWPEPSVTLEELLNVPTLATAAVLTWTTISNSESWPLNHIGLFPYNHRQVEHLSSLFGRFSMQLRASQKRPCLAELTVQGFPSSYHPTFCHAVGIEPESVAPDVTIARLQQWLDTIPFLEFDGFGPLTSSCLRVESLGHMSETTNKLD